jgi:hypothetical protein
MTTAEVQEKYILNIVSEFARDLSVAFPEYAHLWNKWETVPESTEEQRSLIQHLRKVYLGRFFDVLNQNETIFSADSSASSGLEFLPNVDFRVLFLCDGISESIKQSIWKYLQLITFALLKCDGVDDMRNFFENGGLEQLNEETLKEKIAEAMESMRGFFSESGAEGSDDENENEENDTEDDKREVPGFHPGKFFKNMFGGKGGMFDKLFTGLGEGGNPQDILDRLKELMGGKIGKLATELMEEAADDFKEAFGDESQFSDAKSMPEIAQKMLKDPTKLMPLVSKMQAKVEAKMKSGDISREDLQKEAEEMMSKMGMDSSMMQEMAQNMLKQMGGLGKGMRMDKNAMNNHFKKMSMREKVRERYERRKAAEALAASQKTAEPQNRVFTVGDEKQPKSKKEDAEVAWDLERIAAEIEGTSSSSTTTKNKKKSKK